MSKLNLSHHCLMVHHHQNLLGIARTVQKPPPIWFQSECHIWQHYSIECNREYNFTINIAGKRSNRSKIKAYHRYSRLLENQLNGSAFSVLFRNSGWRPPHLEFRFTPYICTKRYPFRKNFKFDDDQSSGSKIAAIVLNLEFQHMGMFRG